MDHGRLGRKTETHQHITGTDLHAQRCRATQLHRPVRPDEPTDSHRPTLDAHLAVRGRGHRTIHRDARCRHDDHVRRYAVRTSAHLWGSLGGQRVSPRLRGDLDHDLPPRTMTPTACRNLRLRPSTELRGWLLFSAQSLKSHAVDDDASREGLDYAGSAKGLADP